MHYITFFLVFTFGIVIGSFLNVVAFRLKTGRNIGGRSFCFSCGKTLSAFELIPVFSFLIQGGKCRSCKSSISRQYPLVEILTGLVFGFVAMNVTSVFWFFLYTSAFSILIVIAVYDARHKIIPDSLAFCFAVLGLIAMLNAYWEQLVSLDALLAFLAGPILFLPFFLLWFISKGLWMGLGDAKLAIGIGWLLGIASGFSAIIIGIWIGAIWSLGAIVLSKANNSKKHNGLNLKSEIPLAPFLILGTFISFLTKPDIFNINAWIEIFFK